VITPALPPGARKTRILGLALFIGLALIAKEKLNRIYDALPGGGEAGATDPGFRSEDGQGRSDGWGKVIQLPVYPKSMPLSRFGETLRALRSGVG
jgi:hypothetical protein